jgi:hypothetical protein
MGAATKTKQTIYLNIDWFVVCVLELAAIPTIKKYLT